MLPQKISRDSKAKDMNRKVSREVKKAKIIVIQMMMTTMKISPTEHLVKIYLQTIGLIIIKKLEFQCPFFISKKNRKVKMQTIS